MTTYRVAGVDLSISPSLSQLSAFKAVEDAAAGIAGSAPLPAGAERLALANGLVGGERREVGIWSAPPGIRIRVAGAREICVGRGGEVIYPDPSAPADSLGSAGLDAEVILGPALVLALAMRGRWCLHASAALYGDDVFVLLGESGKGKSTLSSYLSGSRPGWTLVADDILPVTPTEGRLRAWPRFPQLKISPEAQPGTALQEQLPVGAVVLLDPAVPGSDPLLEQLSQGDAVKALLSHTAGARLFDRGLLEEHMSFCARAASVATVFRLEYPHRLDGLPAIAELLEALA